MNKFYEQNGYRFAFGSQSLIESNVFFDLSLQVAIAKAQQKGCGYLVTKKNRERRLICWLYQKMARPEVSSRYQGVKEAEKALKLYPNEKEFIVTLGMNSPEFLSQSQWKSVDFISALDVCDAVLFLNQKYVQEAKKFVKH